MRKLFFIEDLEENLNNENEADWIINFFNRSKSELSLVSSFPLIICKGIDNSFTLGINGNDSGYLSFIIEDVYKNDLENYKVYNINDKEEVSIVFNAAYERLKKYIDTL